MTEYIKRTNAEHPLPVSLSYVSGVDQNFYTVTTFSTQNLIVEHMSIHDDRHEYFNFLTQKYEKVNNYDDVLVDSLATVSDNNRVKSHSSDPTKYLLRGDDGWFEMNCPIDEQFDANAFRCVPIPVCHNKQVGVHGMTENLLDRLVLNHRTPRVVDDDNVQSEEIHRTIYLRCVEGGSAVVEECPNGYLFDVSQGRCVMRNDCENRPDGYVLSQFPESLNIDQYMICRDGDTVIQSCPVGQIFDRRLMSCVEAHPCQFNGAGHTYITNDIGPTQFYKCQDSENSILITCINRVFVNDEYQCSGDSRCSVFENGTGTQIKVFDDEILSYDQGILVCDNYNVIKNIDCDDTNILENRIYNNRFVPMINLPKEIYSIADSKCVSFDFSLVRQNNDTFGIESVPNDYNIKFETAFTGRTSSADRLIDITRIDSVVSSYARDFNFVGFNFLNEQEINCVQGSLYDIFEGRRLNLCTSDDNFRQIIIRPNEFYKSKNVLLEVDSDYREYCAARLDNNMSQIFIFDNFLETFSVNIRQFDECHNILNKIHIKYTTIDGKYTTVQPEYNFKSVNDQKNIERYAENIQNSEDTIPVLFDPFEHIETVKPLFNPFAENTIARDLPDFPDLFPPYPPPRPPPPPPPVIPEPEPEPELTLRNKFLNYSCFFSLPTFKMSHCDVVDDHIIEAIANIRQNVQVHDDCVNAEGIKNVINAYVYLGNDIGCRTEFTDDGTIHVNRVNEPTKFMNLTTQSNDGIKYNHWIHTNDGINYLACPHNLYNSNRFTCSVESNRLYYMQDLQN
ncbi:VP91 [Chrysodeixis chalcites nucleopolyhedrovirus]|uniref:VP91 n=1 Tax=Chrysodeixis chalcites nucleopolyhedrovirus TaxID=320432 RepID=Q4KSZ9_9ABAC|nr:VP91 [Chrysodeixis chalcites nucleopolyhedrovirus]AAY84012.1 VP91 [Chrysodeixis chalcites nucleopolyhedrovirus]AGE61641.1 VP91 [Chrysodeixis chalcites nucleopolyhedrovirus]AGE61790.1 VP91 [Chrysodeixis chalcites nucleopolyhedrovirus]